MSKRELDEGVVDILIGVGNVEPGNSQSPLVTASRFNNRWPDVLPHQGLSVERPSAGQGRGSCCYAYASE